MAKDIFSNLESVIPNDAAYLLDPSLAPAKPIQSNKPNDTVSGEASATTLPVDELIPFKAHPFTVNTNDDDFKELVQSIKDNGIISEILVRPCEDGMYEIISGHRRTAAAREAGLTEVPVIIKELSDYQATVLMVHSNLYREKINHSEKAKAYRMIRDAEKHQGIKGTDTAAMIGEGHDSKRQVYRYIRLSYLNDELLYIIDAGDIAFQTGVELGSLDEESQNNLLSFIKIKKQYPSFEDAMLLKSKFLNDAKSLSVELINDHLAKEAKEKKTAAKGLKPKTKISFKISEIERFFKAGTDPEELEDVIMSLLIEYKNRDTEA